MILKARVGRVGVSRLAGLRQGLTQLGGQMGWNTFIPGFEYYADNAAMMAVAGCDNFSQGRLNRNRNIAPLARMPF